MVRVSNRRNAVTTSIYENLPLRGNPFGTMRPAVARALFHSPSSSSVRVKVRPDESCQVSPNAMMKVRTSSAPPSL